MPSIFLVGQNYVLDPVDTTELYKLSISLCAGKDFRLSFFHSIRAQVSHGERKWYEKKRPLRRSPMRFLSRMRWHFLDNK